MQSFIDLLAHKNDLYLDEMQWWLVETFELEVSLVTISRALKRIDWGKKKQALIATQRDNQKRAEWVFKIQAWHYSQFVFIDESGVDRRDCLRRTGW
jgi:hypothetical protein